jgi:hypothetical protein
LILKAWHNAGLNKFGSHVVDKFWAVAELKTKKWIAAELLAREDDLKASAHWCGSVVAYRPRFCRGSCAALHERLVLHVLCVWSGCSVQELGGAKHRGLDGLKGALRPVSGAIAGGECDADGFESMIVAHTTGDFPWKTRIAELQD